MPAISFQRPAMSFKFALVITPFLILSGCASITSSEMQTLSLTAKSGSGEIVEKADCTLKNDKGEWQAKTPAQVMVHRSAEDLVVTCRKEGFADGLIRAISRAAGSMFGNILFGGGIGALIDHNKGNGYDYPNNLPLKMGEAVTVDRRTEELAEQALAQQQSTGATTRQ
jgi:hypothetical protein